jgi:hypothetical protein
VEPAGERPVRKRRPAGAGRRAYDRLLAGHDVIGLLGHVHTVFFKAAIELRRLLRRVEMQRGGAAADAQSDQRTGLLLSMRLNSPTAQRAECRNRVGEELYTREMRSAASRAGRQRSARVRMTSPRLAERLFEPVVGERLVVERRDLDPAG